MIHTCVYLYLYIENGIIFHISFSFVHWKCCIIIAIANFFSKYENMLTISTDEVLKFMAHELFEIFLLTKSPLFLCRAVFILIIMHYMLDFLKVVPFVLYIWFFILHLNNSLCNITKSSFSSDPFWRIKI